MDNYEFKNIFSIMGIENYDNPTYLQAYIRVTIGRLNRVKASKIRDEAKVEASTHRELLKQIAVLKEKLKSLKSELERNLSDTEKSRIESEVKQCESELKEKNDLAEQHYKKFVELTETANHMVSKKTKEEESRYDTENNVNILILNLIQLLDELYRTQMERNPEIAEKEEVKAALYAGQKFSTPEDVNSYISNELSLRKYVDFDNLNLSESQYKNNSPTRDKRPLYVYNTVPKKKPILFLSRKKENGDTVRVYIIGTFEYGSNLRDKVEVLKYTKDRIHHFEPSSQSETFTMFTVVTEDKQGNKTEQNVMMNTDFSNIPNIDNQDFLGNVVFSNLVIENAVKNNSGLIGSVVMKDGHPYVTADFDAKDSVRAISYALSDKLTFDSIKDEKWYSSPGWNWDNPRWVYKEMNEVIRQMEEEKSKRSSGAPTFPNAPGDSDEGGR